MIGIPYKNIGSRLSNQIYGQLLDEVLGWIVLWAIMPLLLLSVTERDDVDVGMCLTASLGYKAIPTLLRLCSRCNCTLLGEGILFFSSFVILLIIWLLRCGMTSVVVSFLNF